MTEASRPRGEGVSWQRPTANVTAGSAQEMTLAARERAVLARERAVGRREEAATATAQHRALDDTRIREANEQLVVASVRALTMTEAAEDATKRMAHKAERD